MGLLYDSVSANTGDIAMGIAARQEFARCSEIVPDVLDPLDYDSSQYDMVIIGGGEIIRKPGDPFYDAFRPSDGAVLNAVGVSPGARDFKYLANYDFVSVRSAADAAMISRDIEQVRLVPCTTTTLESEKYDIPGVEDGEPLVGVHLVPYTLEIFPDILQTINEIPGRKVLIPFTHYNYDADFMAALPFDRSQVIELGRLDPLELHSVLGQMRYSVVSSLHASVFSYSQNVPFLSVEQGKVRHYFEDRGLERFIFKDRATLRAGIDEIEGGGVDLSALVAKDRAAVRDAYRVYVEIAERRAADETLRQGVRWTAPISDRDLHLLQHKEVVIGRDGAVQSLAHTLMGARLEMVSVREETNALERGLAESQEREAELCLESARCHEEIRTLQQDLVEAREREGLVRAEIYSSPRWRIGHAIFAPFSALVRLVFRR